MRKPRTVAIIQARMSSTRFPGKVLFPLAGKNSIQWIVDRVRGAAQVDRTVIATATNPADGAIVGYCKSKGIEVFCGDENDVMQRMLDCARSADAELIVDITGDCPLVDPRQIDFLVNTIIARKYKYVSNVGIRSWPDGFDVQVYYREALKDVDKRVVKPEHRAHSGWNVMKHIGPIMQWNYEAPKECFYPGIGLTLDTREDAQVLHDVLMHFTGNPFFSAEEVIKFVTGHPDVLDANKSIERKIPGEG